MARRTPMTRPRGWTSSRSGPGKWRLADPLGGMPRYAAFWVRALAALPDTWVRVLAALPDTPSAGAGSCAVDERELVGLLYRADWSRLALTGSLRGAGGSLLSMFGGSKRQPLFWRQPPPEAHPPFLTPDLVDGEIGLRVAPGLRFRVDAADGRWAGGCDGSR